MESVGRDNVSNSSIVTPPLHDLFSMEDLPRSERGTNSGAGRYGGRFCDC